MTIVVPWWLVVLLVAGGVAGMAWIIRRERSGGRVPIWYWILYTGLLLCGSAGLMLMIPNGGRG